MKREWTLWVVAGSAAIHATEELLTGWQAWAATALGIVMPTSIFVIANIVLVAAATATARIGWRRPTIALVIPTATLVNGVLFHILPTILTSAPAPGVYSAVLLYVPFSTLAIVGASRDGVDRRQIAVAMGLGTLMAITVVIVARAFSVR